MVNNTIKTAIGLMSGTSMDGIDIAMIKSDGGDFIERCGFSYFPYQQSMKENLQKLVEGAPTLSEIKFIENEFSLLNAKIVNDFLQKNKIDKSKIDAIGFHGHTILHNPKHFFTWQIANPHLLAVRTGIDVVADFRGRDIALNGQGAPLVPIYHFHLLNKIEHPSAVLNIGGVANITYLNNNNENDMEACDICFGNAPLNDVVKQKLNLDFDEGGNLASSGNINFAIADDVLQNEIFHQKSTKSFDRNDFSYILSKLENFHTEDALATLIYILANAVKIHTDLMFSDERNKLKTLFICGGGAKNKAIVGMIKNCLPKIDVRKIDEIGLNPDSIEAEAFAFLAIRHLKNLPISFQKTTGVSQENSFSLVLHPENPSSCGGVFYRA
jgi:anhydro-N-acetylmuramic acid kinase